jgi:hypothetical protein
MMLEFTIGLVVGYFIGKVSTYATAKAIRN